MTRSTENRITSKPEAIIFDVDGTLYNQKKLRKAVFFALLGRLLTFRATLTDIRILICFRKERELRKGHFCENLAEEQYRWCSEKLRIAADKVKKTVEKFMYQLPLPFIKRYKFDGIGEFFNTLKKKNIRIIIYSDYPADEKLISIGLDFDASYCSTDPGVNQLKPGARALQKICKETGIKPSNMIYIGDREETDGIASREAGIPYLQIDIQAARKGSYYQQLTRELISLYGPE